MPKNELVVVPAETWTELTDSDVTTEIGLQVVGVGHVRILATVDASAPDESDAAGWVYAPGEADRRTLAEMFDGLSNPVRLWAWAPAGGVVMVSHA